MSSKLNLFALQLNKQTTSNIIDLMIKYNKDYLDDFEVELLMSILDDMNVNIKKIVEYELADAIRYSELSNDIHEMQENYENIKCKIQNLANEIKNLIDELDKPKKLNLRRQCNLNLKPIINLRRSIKQLNDIENLIENNKTDFK